MIVFHVKLMQQRIVARPGSKQYGRLSVIVQQQCKAHNLFNIPGKAFVPPPKVDATAVYIEPLITPIDKGGKWQL